MNTSMESRGAEALVTHTYKQRQTRTRELNPHARGNGEQAFTSLLYLAKCHNILPNDLQIANCCNLWSTNKVNANRGMSTGQGIQ